MSARLRRRLADESGVTLVELLVTMIMATIVVIALFTFQDIVLRGSGRTIAKADATQRARGALANLESRLHSSCIAEDVIPILAGSSYDKISFISRYGSALNLTPEKHTVTVKANGTMTDSTYALASGSSPGGWVFSNTPSSTTTLLENVDRATSSNPAFRYYAYGIARDSGGNEYIDAAGDPYMILLDGSATLPNGTRTKSGSGVPDGTIPANSPTTLTTPLSASGSKLATAVGINLTVRPGGRLGEDTTDTSIPASVTDTVVLRLTPVSSDEADSDGLVTPCH